MDRCAKCRKYSVVFSCKCGVKLCSKHVLPEKHSCLAMGEFCVESKDANRKILSEGLVKQTYNLESRLE